MSKVNEVKKAATQRVNRRRGVFEDAGEKTGRGIAGLAGETAGNVGGAIGGAIGGMVDRSTGYAVDYLKDNFGSGRPKNKTAPKKAEPKRTPVEPGTPPPYANRAAAEKAERDKQSRAGATRTSSKRKVTKRFKDKVTDDAGAAQYGREVNSRGGIAHIGKRPK